MKKKAVPQIPKLVIEPEGALVDIRLELAPPMGIAYERCLNFVKDTHAHDRVVICAARGSTRAEIRDFRSGAVYVNTCDVVILKPPGFQHSIKSLTAVYDDVSLLPTVEFVNVVATGCGYNQKSIKLFLSVCREVNRSTWLNELIEQYFKRRILQNSSNQWFQEQLRVLEKEIIAELLWLVVGKANKNMPSRTQANSLTSIVSRSLDYIEANLFNKIDLSTLAKVAGASRSVLLRRFKQELNTSPLLYIRRRRLDEAKRLLEQQGKTVAEVATLVAYEDVSAFCRAYRQVFGASPREK